MGAGGGSLQQGQPPCMLIEVRLAHLSFLGSRIVLATVVAKACSCSFKYVAANHVFAGQLVVKYS